MADIGKEADRINKDLNQINSLISNPLFKYLAIGLGIFVLAALVILKI